MTGALLRATAKSERNNMPTKFIWANEDRIVTGDGAVLRGAKDRHGEYDWYQIRRSEPLLSSRDPRHSATGRSNSRAALKLSA